jgi:hypothetical protein
MSKLYKGRWIDPRAYELRDGTGWSAEVCVAEDVGSETLDTRFLLAGVFPTRASAIDAAVSVGKRKVDEAITSDDIHSVMDDETRLPSTYRRGYGTDDVAEGADGRPTKVDRPDNPGDIYK